MVVMASSTRWKDDGEDSSRPCAHPSLPSEEDREEGGCGRCSALALALRSADPRGDCSDPRGDLAVGALPRRPDAGRRAERFAGSASLPAPRAPFLCAREGPQGRLSSMPEIALPPSAVDADPAARSAVPYGSLRDSRFGRPRPSAWTASPRAPVPPRGGGAPGGAGPASTLPASRVGGIAEGCRALALGEPTGPLATGSLPHLGGGGDDGAAPPFSSSLTALDVLAGLRAARNASPSRGGGAPGDGAPGAGVDGPVTSMSSDDDDGEQFELELDG